MLSDQPLRKEDLDLYLKELAKEFRKLLRIFTVPMTCFPMT